MGLNNSPEKFPAPQKIPLKYLPKKSTQQENSSRGKSSSRKIPLNRNFRGWDFPREEFSMGNFSCGEFPRIGEADFPVLFEKRLRIKCKKQVFSTESNEQH